MSSASSFSSCTSSGNLVWGWSVKYSPIDGRTCSGLPEGWRCILSTSSLPGIQAPRESIRLDVRRAAGLPEQEIAVGIERAAADHQVHAGKAFAGRGLLQVRRSRAVHQQVGVMHHARLAGADLDGAHPASRGQVGSEDDVPINIGPGSGQLQPSSPLPAPGRVCQAASHRGKTEAAGCRRLVLRERRRAPKPRWSRSARGVRRRSSAKSP